MPARKNSQDKYHSLTFDCRIRVNKENEDFFEIKRTLSNSLAFYLRYNLDERDDSFAVQRTINSIFNRRVVLEGNVKAYLVNYSELEGSFMIEFTILVVGAIVNYGSIRETLDYFADDLERILRNSLANHRGGYTVESYIEDKTRPSAVNDQYEESEELSKLSNKVRANRILIGILGFLFIFLLSFQLLSLNKEESELVDNSVTRRIVAEEIRSQKIDDHLKAKKDTIYIRLK